MELLYILAEQGGDCAVANSSYCKLLGYSKSKALDSDLELVFRSPQGIRSILVELLKCEMPIFLILLSHLVTKYSIKCCTRIISQRTEILILQNAGFNVELNNICK